MMICTVRPFAIDCKLGNDQRNGFGTVCDKDLHNHLYAVIYLTRVCYMWNTDLRRFDAGEKRKRKEKLH